MPINETTGAEGNSLFITNLSHRANESDLRSLYSSYGDILDIYIPTVYGSNRRKGIAYVEFAPDNKIHQAVKETHQIKLVDTNIEVKIAEGRRKSKSEYIRRSGGYRDRRYDDYHRRNDDHDDYYYRSGRGSYSSSNSSHHDRDYHRYSTSSRNGYRYSDKDYHRRSRHARSRSRSREDTYRRSRRYSSHRMSPRDDHPRYNRIDRRSNANRASSRSHSPTSWDRSPSHDRHPSNSRKHSKSPFDDSRSFNQNSSCGSISGNESRKVSKSPDSPKKNID